MRLLSFLLFLPLLAAAVTGSGGQNSNNTDNNPPPSGNNPPPSGTAPTAPTTDNASPPTAAEIPHQSAWELGHTELTAWPHVRRFFVRRWTSATMSWIAPNSVAPSLPALPTTAHGPEGCGCVGGWSGRFESDVYGPVERHNMWTWMPDWADHPDRPTPPYRAWIPDVWIGGGPCPRLPRWNNLWQGFPGETTIQTNDGYRFTGAVEKEMRRADEIDAQLVSLIWPSGNLPPELAPFDDEVFNGVKTYQDLRAAWGRWVQRSLDRRGRIIYELFWGEQRGWIMTQLPDVWVELRRIDYWGRSSLGAWYHNTRDSADIIRRHISYGVPVIYCWEPEYEEDDNLQDLAPRDAPSEELATLPLTPPRRREVPVEERRRDTPYTHRHTRRAYFDTESPTESVEASPRARALSSVNEVPSTLGQNVNSTMEEDAVSLGGSSVDRFEAEYLARRSSPPDTAPVPDAVVVDSGMVGQFNVFVRAHRDVIIEAISAEEAAVRHHLQPESFRPISSREAADRYGLRAATFRPGPYTNEGASGSSLSVQRAVPDRTVSSSPRTHNPIRRGRSSSSSRSGLAREPVLLTRMRQQRPPSAGGSSAAGATLSERLSAPGVTRDDSSDSLAVSTPSRSFANTPAGVHEPSNGHADWTFVLVDSGPATDRFRGLLENGAMATHEARLRYAVEHHLPYATAFLHVAYRGEMRSYNHHQVPEEWFIQPNMSPAERLATWRMGVFRILRRGHARAALARGGLIARIAEMGGVGVNEALNGPSEDARSNGSPYTFRTLGGRDLVDDWLSEDEITILLGRVGRGGSASLWPAPNVLYRGNDDEAWNGILEAWFVERWHILHAGSDEDLMRTHKSWRGFMKLLNENRGP